MAQRACPSLLGESIRRPVQVLPVELAQQLMRGQVARALRDGDPQFLLRLGKPFGLHQGLAKQRMKAGLEVQQAKRFGGCGNGFVEPPRLEMNPGQLPMHERILRIELECRFQERASRLQVPQLGQRAGDPLVHALVHSISLGQFLQILPRFGRPFFQQGLADQQPLH